MCQNSSIDRSGRIDPFLHQEAKFIATARLLKKIPNRDYSRIDVIGQNGNTGEHYYASHEFKSPEEVNLKVPPGVNIHKVVIDEFVSRDVVEQMMGGKGSVTQSDGAVAPYYELPEGAKELQDIISYKNMNAQIGEIFRACMRYGEVDHSELLRDAKKMQFYSNEEVKRLEKYGW